MYDDLSPGTAVECRDGRMGTLERLVRDEKSGRVTELIVRGEKRGDLLRVPASYLTKGRAPNRIELNCTLDELEKSGAVARTDGDFGEPGQVVVPVIAEDLVARKRTVEVGELLVRKVIEERERSISEPVNFDEVVVERVPVGRRIDEEPIVRQDGETLIVPVVEEQLVCEKQRVLVEEIRITRRQRTETRQLTGTVRHERAVIDKGRLTDRVHEVGEKQ